MGKLGHVAIDTTRVAANASRHRVDSVEKLRQIRHWQQACDRTDPDEAPGTQAGWRRVKLCDIVSDTDESQSCALRQPACSLPGNEKGPRRNSAGGQIPRTTPLVLN
jgi:hypothetical protein